MAYLLSTPNTRCNIACMQAGFFLITILLQIILLAVSGVITSEISFPGYLDIQAYIILNIGVFLLFGVFSGISFLSSCIFNDTKNSLALGAGLPLAFIIISILANVDESLHFLRNFTVISLLDTDAIIAGNDYISKFAVMTLISLLLYTSGIYIFTKKDLSI
jgi:ABC-2 type transport system permease protein